MVILITGNKLIDTTSYNHLKKHYKDEQEIDLVINKFGFKKVEVDSQYSDCKYEDFNEDLTFNVVKYNDRKVKESKSNYEELIVLKIRQRYSINQELAILRQRDTKAIEYQEYFDYVEQCKTEAKAEVGIL